MHLSSWLCLVVLIGGCAAPSARQVVSPAGIYERANRTFARAVFYKPAETNIDKLTLRLAPLILQEVSGTNSSTSLLNEPGHLEFDGGSAVVRASGPVLYYLTDTVDVAGKAHARLTFLWFYVSMGLPGEISVQGVRMTLDSSGRPALWEVLADETGADLILVARSVEDAAAAQFRKPLPGHRYVTERSPAEAPRTVVARIIEDGPVPMGPIVYLDAATRSVSTLICRCMPAQAKSLSGTEVYELRPWPGKQVGSVLRQSKVFASEHFSFWPDDAGGGGSLEKRLRLPAGW